MIRIGTGIDFHIFERGRKMVIGGVDFGLDYGLKGHSDADVLTHAIMDAILGALGEGDIGEWFSDKDPKYENADSIKLLHIVLDEMNKKGYSIINIDATIVGEKPKISPKKEEIKEKLAHELGIEKELLNIKATTTEKMGSIGNGEGIASVASVLLEKRGHGKEK